MQTIDADTHLIESERTWEFIDKEFLRHKPQLLVNSDPGATATQREFWRIDGALFPKRFFDFDRSGTTEEAREARSVDARLAHMTELGVDVQVLYPTLFLIPISGKPEVEFAIHTAYNRWAADICANSHGRLRWAAQLPLLSMDRAITELRWAVEHGACAVHMRPYDANRPPSSTYFYPLYAEAERLNVPICLHAGNGSTIQSADLGPYPECVFPFVKLAPIGAFHSLLISGTCAKFPKLRWGIIEVSASWIPYLFHDLPPRMSRLLGRKLDPSYHLLRDNNAYVGCQTDDDLPYVLKYAGEETLIIGSDYGHADTSSELEALRHLSKMNEVSERAANKILYDNPKRLYAL